MDDSENLVEAKVLVPRERLPEFYEQYARWLRSETVSLQPDSGTEPTGTTPLARKSDDESESTADDPRGMEAWTESEGWSGSDIADALIIYKKLSPGAKRFMNSLLARPGEKMTGEFVAKDLGLSQAQLTGTLASVGIRSKAVGRDVPFRYESGPDGGSYRIESGVANLFTWARAVSPETLALAVRYDEHRHMYGELYERRKQMMYGPDDPHDGYEVGGIEAGLMLSLEEVTFELERTFRQAMNLPEPEESPWLRMLRQSFNRSTSDESEEVQMAQSE